jgi:hypothetical protein
VQVDIWIRYLKHTRKIAFRPFCVLAPTLSLNCSFVKVRNNTPKQFVRLVRIIEACPRHNSVIGTKLLVKMIQAMACLLADADTLLQQVA